MATPRLLEKYRKEIAPQLVADFGLQNIHAAPRLEKVVVNMGVGEAIADVKILDRAMEELALVTGQKAVMRRAKKAISNFKIKQNQPVGCMVTLRKAMMYEFIDRLVNIAMPRIRDFRGISSGSFDRHGNYTLGLTEQHIFPEIDYDKISRAQGMDITFVIKNARTREQAQQLLKLLGMPFSREEKE